MPCPPPFSRSSAVRTMYSPRAAARSAQVVSCHGCVALDPSNFVGDTVDVRSRLPGTGPRMPSCLCSKDRNPPPCACVGAAAGFNALVMGLWRALCITRLCGYAPYERRSSIMLCRLWRLDSTWPYVDRAAVTGQTCATVTRSALGREGEVEHLNAAAIGGECCCARAVLCDAMRGAGHHGRFSQLDARALAHLRHRGHGARRHSGNKPIDGLMCLPHLCAARVGRPAGCPLGVGSVAVVPTCVRLACV